METKDRTQGKVIGAQDPVRINIRKHVGKYTNIQDVELKKGEYGPYIVLRTRPVETIKGKEGDIHIRGTKIFNLKENEEGDLYWHKGGKLDLFLTKYDVKTYDDLIGAEVQLIPITSKKDGKEYLSFD